jgi:hypothetical protein
LEDPRLLEDSITSAYDISDTSLMTPSAPGRARSSVARPLELEHALAQGYMEGRFGLEQPHRHLMVLQIKDCIQDSRGKGRPFCSLLSRRRCE